MQFSRSLEKALVISIIITTIIYGQAQNKLSYHDPSLNEAEATSIWMEILSNPSVPDEQIFEAIKIGDLVNR